jgi:putative transposase
MPRIARVVIPEIAHHITQRGNYQQIIFHSGDDKVVIKRLMGDGGRRSIVQFCHF